MTDNNWQIDDPQLSIAFHSRKNPEMWNQFNIPNWHQPPAIPERQIRAGMLQFISDEPLGGEDQILVSLLELAEAKIAELAKLLNPPPRIHVDVFMAKAYPFGFYSQDPMGFTDEEIGRIHQMSLDNQDSTPDPESIGITCTTVDVRTLRTTPPVFERVKLVKGQMTQQVIILGLHDHPAERLLPAVLGRFFHAVGHVLIAERVTGEDFEHFAQIWSEGVLDAIAEHARHLEKTVTEILPLGSPAINEIGSLSLEELCKFSIPAVFTAEVSGRKQLQDLLEEHKEALGLQSNEQQHDE